MVTLTLVLSVTRFPLTGVTSKWFFELNKQDIKLYNLIFKHVCGIQLYWQNARPVAIALQTYAIALAFNVLKNIGGILIQFVMKDLVIDLKFVLTGLKYSMRALTSWVWRLDHCVSVLQPLWWFLIKNQQIYSYV